MLRNYETLWVARGDLPPEDVDALVTELEAVVRNGDGRLTNVEKQGRRQLAYRIAGLREGYYNLFEIESESTVIVELERRMRLSDKVIRYMSVVIDEDRKKVEKLGERRRDRKAKKLHRKQGESTGESAEGSSVESAPEARAETKHEAAASPPVSEPEAPVVEAVSPAAESAEATAEAPSTAEAEATPEAAPTPRDEAAPEVPSNPVDEVAPETSGEG